ncbi:glutaredoxin family protein [Endozoicomonas elysicola]|uniref:Glutaredoxin n=1 Tax=Endozoicomonas elysicola TaxID=305900 RepID=A0A081K6M2_9GAMM|nr:glutaredoxin [Endozoicomonas elysicola]KEI69798.1 glutaredoxin [Endozoicomonas elysicola]
MLLKIIRNVLGYGIAAADKLTRPKAMARSPEQQAQVNAQTANMTLYQFKACPFCIKTRRAIHKLGLNIQTKDAMNDAQARNELQQMGGKVQVPCLRIQEEGKDDTWMYESGDISHYLQKRFG